MDILHSKNDIFSAICKSDKFLCTFNFCDIYAKLPRKYFIENVCKLRPLSKMAQINLKDKASFSPI